MPSITEKSNVICAGDLEIKNIKHLYRNLSSSRLIEECILRREGKLSSTGAVMVNTGEYTGRSPLDKYIVQSSHEVINTVNWGKVNQPISNDCFDSLFHRAVAYLKEKDIFIEDLSVAANPEFQIPIRVISEMAWSSLFAHNLFIRNRKTVSPDEKPEFVILHCPGLTVQPDSFGIRSKCFILLELDKRLLVIGGTGYAGEIKKGVFTALNYYLPRRNVLSMHCSASLGGMGDVALFFGLSGTGKTTLSSDPHRQLIGDDEHGWSDDGVFNIEGGCYAKTINLRSDLEPQIWSAVNRFGAVLENVDYEDVTREPDFESNRFTENARAAYPIDFIPNSVLSGQAGHPKNIFFLTADAFGVMPPLAKLTEGQTMYYFLSGYTSKLAGTEKDLGKEPQATFSACFGAPFLPLHPSIYAKLLGEKIKVHRVNVWLLNTGWTGGPFGIGKRIFLPHTRAMVSAVLNQTINEVSFQKDDCFGLLIPEKCPGVPSEILNPVNTWQNKEEYINSAARLAGYFRENISCYENELSQDILDAGL